MSDDSYTILLVEDDSGLADALENSLDRAGHRIHLAPDAKRAYESLRDEIPDLILLDLILPDKHGFEVLSWLRERDRRVPIIIITGQRETESLVEGLDLGADDYVTKPVNHKELLARVNRTMKRLKTLTMEEEPQDISPYQNGDLVIDYARHLVTVAGREIALSPTQYNLLCVFAEHTGQALSHAGLLREAWGNGYSDPQVVRSAVSGLRGEMEPEVKATASQDWQYILTVTGFGYRLKDYRLEPPEPGV